MEAKKVIFRYNSEEKTIKMSFMDNLIVTNDGRTEIREQTTVSSGWDKESIPLIAAKECLQEMLVILDAASEEAI